MCKKCEPPSDNMRTCELEIGEKKTIVLMAEDNAKATTTLLGGHCFLREIKRRSCAPEDHGAFAETATRNQERNSGTGSAAKALVRGCSYRQRWAYRTSGPSNKIHERKAIPTDTAKANAVTAVCSSDAGPRVKLGEIPPRMSACNTHNIGRWKVKPIRDRPKET